MDLNAIAANSPLIGWLFGKLPLLQKSLIISLIITWLTGSSFASDKLLPFFASIFVVTTVITSYAPNILPSVEHGLGFALAFVLIGFTFKGMAKKI